MRCDALCVSRLMPMKNVIYFRALFTNAALGLISERFRANSSICSFVELLRKCFFSACMLVFSDGSKCKYVLIS
jgi:hypothetical protein